MQTTISIQFTKPQRRLPWELMWPIVGVLAFLFFYLTGTGLAG